MLPVSAIVLTIVVLGGPKEVVALFNDNSVVILFISCILVSLTTISLGSPPRQLAGVAGVAAAGVAAFAALRGRTLRTNRSGSFRLR